MKLAIIVDARLSNLSGMGADEQLGGYSRHRARFGSSENPNWSAVADEIRDQVDRIAERNLGRDNRYAGRV